MDDLLRNSTKLNFEQIIQNPHLPTKEPYENINYEGFETFEDFKKVFSVITDEEKLKKIFEEQKKKDKELQYPPLQLIKQNK